MTHVEAMRRVVAAFDAPDGMPEFCKAIDVLRQAIEQAEQQERIFDCPRCGHCCPGTAEQAQPVGEVSGHDWSTGLLYRDLEPGAPLYTAPPPRQPLTDEEIKALPQWFPSHETAAVLPLIRAIEAAHGIKEQT